MSSISSAATVDDFCAAIGHGLGTTVSSGSRLSEVFAQDGLRYYRVLVQLEDAIDDPFPEELLDVLVTVDDLFHFFTVKRSAAPTSVEERPC